MKRKADSCVGENTNPGAATAVGMAAGPYGDVGYPVVLEKRLAVK
jgi:hypothetical protein